MANAASAEASPHALRVVTRSRSRKMPSSAATMNPICAIGTSTLGWPRDAAQQEDGGGEQHDRGSELVLERYRRRRKLAVRDVHDPGCERHEQCRLRNRKRFRDGSVPQPDGVEEIRGAEGKRGDTELDERAPPSVVGRAFGAASCPTRSHVASKARARPAILACVNGSPSSAITSAAVTMKFMRKIAALVLTEPAARLRTK